LLKSATLGLDLSN